MKALALIFGGEGHERRVSELGACSEAQKLSPLFDLIKIGISPVGDWYIYRGADEKIKSGTWYRDTENLTPTYPIRLGGESGFFTDNGIIAVDAAFPLLHGDRGEDGIIQGALRAAHIPYIGSDVIPSAVTADKAYTKIIAEHLGIPTVPWLAPRGRDKRRIKREAEVRLGYPLFIKPRTLGSSIGAYPVRCPCDFYPAYTDASSYGDVIIERLVEVSYELEFAHYRGTKSFISSPGIVASHGAFYDYSLKYESTDTVMAYPDRAFDKRVTRKARYYARQLAEFLSLGAISRIDFFLTPSGELFFNEINSVPGATDTSLYPRLTEPRIGMPFAADIVESGKLI